MRYEFKDHLEGLSPFQHQRDTFSFLAAHPRAGVFSQPGTGKTRALLSVTEARIQAGASQRALYVCPSGVRQTIGREAERWTDLTPEVLNGPTEQRVEQLRASRSPLVIINYESLRLMTPQLERADFDILICDESTQVRNTASQTHRAVRRLAKICPTRWLATGTPMPRDPLDFFGQFSLIDRRIFGTKDQFNSRYIQYAPPPCDVPTIVGYKNIEELQERIRDHSIRYLKSQCLDLPDKIFVDYPVELQPKQRRVYQEFVKELRAEMPSGAVISIRNALSKWQRLHQAASGFVGNAAEHEWLGDNGKLVALHELLDSLQLHENKVIIWCSWIPSIRLLAKELAEHRPALFYGEVADQDAEIQRFNSDPACRVLIGNSKVGIGCTLNVAHYVVFYELPYFDTEAYEQAQDRNHRIGQMKDVTYYILSALRTVDQVIWKNLQGKLALGRYLTGDDALAIMQGQR